MSVIFCDSNCELWYNILEENKVRLIKMPYTLDGVEYFYDCGKKTDFDHFYKRVREKSLPTTSALNIYNYVEIFEPFFAAGDDILYISFSSHMSDTFSNLDDALKDLKFKYPKTKFIRFDTMNISIGAGILVYHAIKLKNQGKSNEEIVQALTALRNKVCVYVVVDDLNHLRRGARLSGAAAFFGNIMDVKPVLSVINGKLEPVTKIKGRQNAITDVLNKFAINWDKNYKEVWLLGADCDEDLERYSQAIKTKFGTLIDLKVQSIGPVIGSHCGPDSIAIFFMKK